jgi:hypothetical protein
LTVLEEIVLEELGKAQKVTIWARAADGTCAAGDEGAQGNPATREEITIAAKLASVVLAARPLAKAKGALPSVQKARRRLAA